MRRGTLFWGVILILLGGLFLLDNLGVLGGKVWAVFWPLLLIAAGLWGIAGALRRPAVEAEQVAIPLGGAAGAAIRVRFGAGRMELGAGAPPGQLVGGTFGGGVEFETRRAGDRLEVDLRVPHDTFPDSLFPWTWGRSHREWKMTLAPDLPLSLELDSGASDSHLDLTDLRVADLRLKTGASSTYLALPARAGHSRVWVEAGAASVDVRVPAGVAARMRVRAGASAVEVDTLRFPRSGEVYQSADYDAAANKVELEVKAGAGSISLR